MKRGGTAGGADTKSQRDVQDPLDPRPDAPTDASRDAWGQRRLVEAAAPVVGGALVVLSLGATALLAHPSTPGTTRHSIAEASETGEAAAARERVRLTGTLRTTGGGAHDLIYAVLDLDEPAVATGAPGTHATLAEVSTVRVATSDQEAFSFWEDRSGRRVTISCDALATLEAVPPSPGIEAKAIGTCTLLWSGDGVMPDDSSAVIAYDLRGLTRLGGTGDVAAGVYVPSTAAEFRVIYGDEAIVAADLGFYDGAGDRRIFGRLPGSSVLVAYRGPGAEGKTVADEFLGALSDFVVGLGPSDRLTARDLASALVPVAGGLDAPSPAGPDGQVPDGLVRCGHNYLFDEGFPHKGYGAVFFTDDGETLRELLYTAPTDGILTADTPCILMVEADLDR